MRKIISKIAGLMLGLSLAAGASLAFKQSSVAVKAAEGDTHSITGFTGEGVGVIVNNGTAPEAISVTDPGYSVKQVIIGWTHNKSNDGVTASVSIGGSSLGTGTVGGQKTTTTTTIGDGNTSLTGDISITWSNSMTGTGKGTLYINDLTLVEGTGGGGGGGEITYYTVSFDMQSHGSQVSSQSIASGGKVTEPTAPTADGYTFGGWYKEAACSTAWNFSTDTVSAATTLYAKWTANVAPSGGSYTLVTSVSDLANNDLVVIGTVGSTGPVNGVTGMNTSTNKDATVSSTESEWVKYTVTLSGTGFTLADGTDSIYMIAKTIKYDTATVLSVTSDGYLCLDSDATTILYEQSTYIRPYQGKADTAGYTPYAVYKYGEPIDPTLDTLTIKANGSEADSATMNYSIGSALFYAYDESDQLVSDCEWGISDSSIATLTMNGNNVPFVEFVKGGTVTITASKSGYNMGSFSLTINVGTLQSVVVTGSMSKTAYYVGESWSPEGLVATASYSYGYSYDASEDVEWSYNPEAPALKVDSVVATATLGSVYGSSSAQSISVTRTNPIQVLYTQASGASVDVYGYYVGFLDGTGPVIMDGAYGIVIYNKTADVSGYTANETILHVTGSITTFKGLYEIGSASMSVASGSFDAPETPVVYSTNGSETADYASRLTTVTGTPTLVSGSFDSDAGTSDIKMNFTVGTKTVQVFYKSAAQTADADAFAAIKDAVANGDEITIKGFTGWYDGFQVQMNGYVPAVDSYTAEDFAQDLLDQTDAVCEGWKEGDNNYDALVAIWSDLASNDKYPSLPKTQKDILAEADRDEGGTVVEQAMARYDYLTGKYNLSNFINGRTPVVVAGAQLVHTRSNSNVSTIIIVVVALTSITSIGVLLVIKRKRSITE